MTPGVPSNSASLEPAAKRPGLGGAVASLGILLPDTSLALQFLRVRTVSGPTYYCRTGKSFKGHVKEKFLLVDCMVVLSGSYR